MATGQTMVSLRSIAVTAVLLGFLVVSAAGATRTWNNTNTDMNAAGSTSWDAALASGDIAQFGNVTATTQPQLTGDLSLIGVIFNGTNSTGYNLTTANGSKLTLTGTGGGTGPTADVTSALYSSGAGGGTNRIGVDIILAPSTGSRSPFAQWGNGTLLIAGNVSGTGVTVNLNGTGTIQLDGANSYSGGTHLGTSSGFKLIVGSDTALGTGALNIGSNSPTIQAAYGARTLANALTWSSGGVTFAGANNLTFTGNSTLSGSSTRTITAGGTGLTEFSGAMSLASTSLGVAGTGDVIISGAISSSGNGYGNLTKSGTGTLTLSNSANTFAGIVTITGGTLAVNSLADTGSASSLGTGSGSSASDIRIQGGTLRYVGSADSSTNRLISANSARSVTIESSGAGTVNFSNSQGLNWGSPSGAPTLTLGGTNTGANRLANAIQDAVSTSASVIKTGTGKWILSSINNSYTGTTTINGGTLQTGSNSALGASTVTVNSGGTLFVGSGFTHSNTISVASGGTLQGLGTVSGTVSLASGATLAPGNSPGLLTNSGTLTFASGSVYSWELGALSTSNAGTDFDQLVNTGTVSLASGALLSLQLGSFAPDANTFYFSSDRAWTIISSSGAGTLSGAALTIGTDQSAWSSLGSFSTSLSGNNLNLVWTAVSAIPEPATTALLLGLAATAGAFVWRRRATR